MHRPVILNLTVNALRLRFDGPDQRLRLIEVLDFDKVSLTYNGHELVRKSRSSEGTVEADPAGRAPAFRHIYNRFFGPTYPGEYVPPELAQASGTYVLSYPGVAFTFPFKHKSWSDKSDFVTLLSSSAASPASSLAIFLGGSWPEARTELFTKPLTSPRSLALAGRHSEHFADEVEDVVVLGAGRLQFNRRSSPPFVLTLNETTPQDLVAELGPPDSIYRKSDSRITIHGLETAGDRRPSISSTGADEHHERGQTIAVDEDEDAEDHKSPDRVKSMAATDSFYNYFHLGFDALVSPPEAESHNLCRTGENHESVNPQSGLSITKVLLHGNVPGSFSFNRHRRLRWTIQDPADETKALATSETPFKDISKVLKSVWKDSYTDSEEAKSMQRGMVLNRGWGESPDSSIELLGDFEGDEMPKRTNGTRHSEGPKLMNNTELFGFPGLLFEVLKNDTVSCLTTY